MDISPRGLARGLAALVLTMGAASASLLPSPSAHASSTTDLVISEFRLRGASGATDEFIEIANAGVADHTVVASSGTGYGIAASDGVTRCSIPNGTVIPRFGHYLCVNSTRYSVASYPAGDGTTATGDATYTTDIGDNAGIALFDNNSGGDSYDLAHRIDAVGSTNEANTLYKEGNGYPALVPFSIDYSFYRNLSTGVIKSIALTTDTPGVPEDTDDNASDFVFVDTNGTSAGAGQRLGAPGPENLGSPVGNGGLAVSLLDPCVSALAAPNVVRDLTSKPSANSTFGTYEFRRTITNNTGGNVTRLRLRIADVRTFPAPSGTADMRPLTSSPSAVTVDRAPCGSGTSDITVQGTTLEEWPSPGGRPSQVNGGGFNSTLSVGVITLANPLAPGASVDVRLLAGLEQTGSNAVNIIAEAITDGTVALPVLTCLGGEPTLCPTPPTAVDDGPTETSEDIELTVAGPGVLANDTDANNDALTAELVDGPAHGTVTLSADGGYTYTPAADYHGEDSFTYQAHDAVSASTAAARVTLQVTSVDDPPVAVDDGPAEVSEDTELAVAAPGVLANDTDADSTDLTAELVDGPAHGTVTLSADGGYTYTPAADYHGEDSFTYHAHDAVSASTAAATVTLRVTPVDEPMCAGRPATLVGTAGDDRLTGTAGADVIIAGAGNDMINGLGGDDVLCAGPDNDRIKAGTGDDHLYGGSGRDDLFAAAGDDVIAGGASSDFLFAATGDDIMTGGSGRDFEAGGLGNDRLRGGPARDALVGGGGDDRLWGGTGNDLLDGGPGSDHLRGGPGRDLTVG